MNRIQILNFYVIYLTVCVFFTEGNVTFTGYWTQWFDTDTPRVGIGDVETIENIEKEGISICDDRYFVYGAQCRTHIFDEWLEFQESDADIIAPDKLHIPCTYKGLECRNSDQPMEATCRDYQVRFYCAAEGKDIIKNDNSSMIALAAGLTFLFPIVVALVINLCRKYCHRTNNRQFPISRDNPEEHIDQTLFDPPPSYNCLFGNTQTTSSTEHLLQTTNESTSSENQPSQINIHTLPSSSALPANSVTVAEADDCYRQFRDRIKQFPGMHLSVIDMYNMYRDSNTTPPPTYNEALVILATVPKKSEES